MTNEGDSNEFKPGETIAPTAPAQPAVVTSQAPPTPAVQATPATPADFPDNLDLAYNAPDDPLISWSASEFIRHEKSSDWYLALGVADIVLAVLSYLVFRDLVTTSVVIIAGFGLGVYAGLKPKQQVYALTPSGLAVGERFYSYAAFRSFSVLEEGAFTGIQFMPLKRFGAPFTVYYAPDDEATILQILGERLPMEEPHHDPVDKFIKRIRF